MRKLLIASTNKGKVAEFQEILKDLPFSAQGGPASGFEVLSLKEAGIDFDVEETGKTFKENAILKAKEYAKASGLLTIADDSGLEIDALSGAPGIFSARFQGEMTQLEKNEQIIYDLSGVEDKNRTAQFVCIIAIAFPNGDIKTVKGVMKGKITKSPKGENGFGYDPIFMPNGYDKTNAELTTHEKNAISHRGKALEKANEILKDLK